MTAAQRLAALDDLPARDLIGLTEETLGALTEIMNRETTLLRSGQFREASNVVSRSCPFFNRATSSGASVFSRSSWRCTARE